jgi:hypothetical protein
MFSSVYRTARERAASLDRPDRGRIVVSGADRRSYLQGLLTNDVAALEAGRGCYAAYLTPQGRMIADLYVYELGDVVLLTVPREQHTGVLEKLDQFIFSEDVQLGDASGAFSTTAIVGPDAPGIVEGLVGIAETDLASWPEHANRRGLFDGYSVIVTRVTDTGEAGYDLHVETPGAAALSRRLEERGVPAHRIASDQFLKGLLCRPGSDYSRVAPGPWACREEARRIAVRRPPGASPGGNGDGRWARYRSRDQQRPVRDPRQADRSGVPAARLPGAGHRGLD